jgi:hypothetical protein
VFPATLFEVKSPISKSNESKERYLAEKRPKALQTAPFW